MLSARVEVVEPGPHSAQGLLPIPADRVRYEPLPGDVIEVSALVASDEGELPLDELDPVWLLCPRNGCISTLRESVALEPCGELPPQSTACRLPSARFTVPALDPTRSLSEQAAFLVAMVGHIDDTMSTEACLERIGDPDRPAWGPCMMGYLRVRYGPLLRLLTVAIAQGVEVPEFEVDPSELDVAVAPLFNPEIVPLRMAPLYDGPTLDESRAFHASPDEVTLLEPGVSYLFLETSDPRDDQNLVFVDLSGPRETTSFVNFHPSIDTPGILGYGSDFGWVMWAPDSAARFTLYVVLSDEIGGAAAAPFEFEVREP